MEASPRPDFVAYCQAFDEKALKVAKLRYQNMNAQRMEMCIGIATTPFVCTALADFQRQPCEATQAILIDEIIAAYKKWRTNKAAGDRDGLGTIVQPNAVPSTTGKEFWVRYVGGDRYIFHKDTYFAATRDDLRTLKAAIDALLGEEPRDHGWKLCRYLAERGGRASKVTCTCGFARGDTGMSICSNFQKGPYGYCDDCCHDKDCAVHF